MSLWSAAYVQVGPSFASEASAPEARAASVPLAVQIDSQRLRLAIGLCNDVMPLAVIDGTVAGQARLGASRFRGQRHASLVVHLQGVANAG